MASRQPQFVTATAAPVANVALIQLVAAEAPGRNAYTDGCAFLRSLSASVTNAAGALIDPASGGVKLYGSRQTDTGQTIGGLYWIADLTRDEAGRYHLDHHYMPAKFDNVMANTNLFVYIADAAGIAAVQTVGIWSELD